MSCLTRIFSIAALLMLCLFAVSCDDDDAADCTNYFLTDATSAAGVDKLYYDDIGLLEVAIQTVTGSPSRRDEYTYNANHQLIRVDVGNDFVYAEFSYDDEGRLELLQMYSASTGSLSREINYFYGDDGRLSRKDIYDSDKLVFYGLYEYPAADIIELQAFSVKDDDTFDESLSKYTMDNHPKPYPEEYYTAFEMWAGVSVPNNIVSYQSVKDGEVDHEHSYTISYKYNEGGYPVSSTPAGVTYAYSCEPVKEP